MAGLSTGSLVAYGNSSPEVAYKEVSSPRYKEYMFRVIEANNGWILSVGDKFWVYNQFKDLQEGLKGVLTSIELERTK